MRKIVNLNKEIVKQEVKCWHCEKAHWQFPEMKYEKCPDCGNELHDFDVQDHLTSMSIQIDSDTGKVIAYSLDQQFDGLYPGGLYKSDINKLNIIDEKEVVLSKEDTFQKDKGHLGVYVGMKLNFTDEMKDTITTFKSALSNLPKVVEFDVTVDGNKNSGDNKLKVSLETFIVDMVKEHFNNLDIMDKKEKVLKDYGDKLQTVASELKKWNEPIED